MSDLRPKPTEITLGGREFGLLFDLNAIDEIQTRLDIPIAQLFAEIKDQRKGYRALKVVLTILINEAIDDAETNEPRVDERWVGRKVKPADFVTYIKAVLTAFSDGSPEPDDESPNQPGE